MTTIAASGPMWTDGLLWVDGVLHGHEDISRHMSWRWGTAFCLSMASQKGKGRLQVKVEEVPTSDSENSCEVINLHHHKNENSIQMLAPNRVASFFFPHPLGVFSGCSFQASFANYLHWGNGWLLQMNAGQRDPKDSVNLRVKACAPSPFIVTHWTKTSRSVLNEFPCNHWRDHASRARWLCS